MKIVTAALFGLALLVLAGCDSKQPQPQPLPVPARTLNDIMLTAVAPDAQALWDGINAAMDKTGLPVASNMGPEQWSHLDAAARALRNEATALANDVPPLVARSGHKIQAEGNPGALGAAEVQTLIEGDLAGFRSQARELIEVAAAFETAAKAKNAEPLGKLAQELDEACEECHVKYWYPPHK